MTYTTLDRIVRPCPRARILFALAFAAITASAADPTPLPTPAEVAVKPADQEVIALSPFTVTGEKDSGYQATSTLAGSRLNTPIRDIGASISVYTKDFLNDIGATNANELLIYATGMEAAGPGGNFSNGAGNNITEPAVVGDSVRNAPQSGSRARGLASPTFTRNFFTSEVPIDGYNTGTVTVNRGPNAILFGVGSPAGVVDTSLLQADLRRNLNKVEFRYGNNDSLRSTVDFNRVLIPKKLAVRVAALEDKERFNQRPAFETKRRLFGTLTFEPFKSTSIRGNFETGHTRANRPFSVLPFDSTKLWLENDRRAFDWTFYDDPARNPLAAAQNAGGNIPGTNPAQQFRGYYIGSVQTFNTLAFQVANPTRGDGAISTGFRANPTTSNITGAGALALNTIRRQLFDPVFNRDSADDAQSFYETRNIGEMPTAYFPGNRVPAGTKNQGFTNFDIFDWKNRQLDETGRQGDSFRNFNLTLEQRFWKDRVGFEGSYFAEEYERTNRNNYLSSQSNANHVRIDPNLYLPDGRPNPNVGRPFVDSAQAIFNQTRRDREAMRFTGFLRYDFKDLSPTWGKWLGRHTATVLAERTRADALNVGSKLVFVGKYDDFFAANPYAFGRLAKFISYVGPSVIGNNGPLRITTPVTSEPIADGTVVNSTFFEAAAGDPNQATLVTIPYTIRRVFQSGNYSRDVIKSSAVNLQSYWFDDHVITNLGLRRDDDYFQLFSIDNSATPAGLANLYKYERSFDDFQLPNTPNFTAGKQVKSYSVVLRWPQKLISLPRGMDISIFNNISENFTPNGSNTDGFGTLLPSPQGTTREYGLNFSFLNNRFNIRANHYETSVKDASIGRIGALGTMINNAILQTIGFWVDEENRNPQASRQADVDLMFSALPANWKDLNKVAYTGSVANGNRQIQYTQLPNYVDTADYVAKGTEVDVVFNPTRNWRILVNAARNEAVQSNIAPNTQALRARMDAVFKTLANRPRQGSAVGYVYPIDPITGKVTSLDAGAGEGTLGQFVRDSIDVPLANTLAAEGVSSPEIRKYRVNLVTNYTFDRTSPLKGFAIGSGVRWQDKVGIGYPVSFRPDSTVFIDRDNPYYAPAETNVDFFTSYSRKLWKNRLDWKIQLNVRNAIGSQETIAITAQPDGSPAAVRLAPERRWYVTNTFSF